MISRYTYLVLRKLTVVYKRRMMSENTLVVIGSVNVTRHYQNQSLIIPTPTPTDDDKIGYN